MFKDGSLAQWLPIILLVLSEFLGNSASTSHNSLSGILGKVFDTVVGKYFGKKQ